MLDLFLCEVPIITKIVSIFEVLILVYEECMSTMYQNKGLWQVYVCVCVCGEDRVTSNIVSWWKRVTEVCLGGLMKIRFAWGDRINGCGNEDEICLGGQT